MSGRISIVPRPRRKEARGDVVPVAPSGDQSFQEPALRADARLNYDRLLVAAAAAFARDGADTSLKAIARDAGVGIGTLYRHFPTRESLIEATYRNETARLGQFAIQLAAALAPVEAIRTWMDGFLDYMMTKNAMAEALPAILAGQQGLRTQSRDVLRAAIGELLARGREAGTLRGDVSADDVMMALGGITLIAAHESQRDLAARLADLLTDALCHTPSRPSTNR
jgi:AcrR family transcriptional regulator